MALTTTELNQLYLAYFGRPGDVDGLNYYKNWTLADVQTGFSNSPESQSMYGTTFGAAQVNAIYQNLFNRSAEPAGIDYWINAVNNGVNGVKISPAAAAFSILVGAQNADKTAVTNKLAAVTSFLAGLDTTAEILAYSGAAANTVAKNWLATVTSDAATLTAAQASVGTTINTIATTTVANGQTFTLTTGVDTITGTAANDTITAAPGASNANTLTALDTIDGGAGTDTMNVSEIGAAGAAVYALNTAATVRNVEVLNYTTSSDNVGDSVTADVSGWTGLTTVNVVIAGTDAPVTLLNTNGNVTTASVNGATTSAITDAAAAGSDKLATVTLTSTTGLATITSDAVTTLNLNTTSGGATITAAAGTRALTVNTNGTTGGTVTDAEATTLTLNSTGTATTGVTLTTAKATTVTVDAAVATTIADVNIAAATTVTLKGAGAKTISATSTVTALTAVDASTSTGAVTITPALATGVQFTGGTAADTITVGATTKAITTGTGDDKVTVAAVAALGTGGSIDAGTGTDTLAFSTYANAVTASAGTTFEGTVSGFEVLELSGANGVAAAAINLANLDDINSVVMSADNTATTTVSGMTSGGTITFKSNQSAAATVAITNAATGTADVLNIGLSKATALAGVSVVAADVETINITSTETATTLLGTVTHAATLSAVNATTLNVSGNAGVTLGTLTGATALTTIDASAVTTGLVSFTTAALASAATIKGGAGANTIVATAATKAVTYTGKDAVDTITIDNAQSNVLNTAGGNDIIVVGSGVNTVNAGAGNDSITFGAGLNVLTGGAGNDTFIIAAAGANVNTYTTITDATAGDILTFTNQGTETFATAKLTLGDTAVFQDYANLAAAGDGSVNGAIKWFQFSGNTYVVQDLSAGASFVNGTDLVIKLSGLVDLSTATGAGTNAITLA